MTDNRNLLELTAAEKQDLERWAQSRTLPAGDVFRARLILALADGQSYREMVRGMRTSAATIASWRRRFEQDRLDPVLPLSPGRAERHGFEYYRHGTLSLYAALDVKTGKVQGKTAKRHTSAEFIVFLRELVKKARWAKQIHIVLDNLSAHKTKAVEEFLEQNPKVRFHFTPTYSSWLNQVELWFAKIQRDVITRGVFTSVADLARKLRKYIRAYAQAARPFRWTYTDPRRRIRTYEITGTAY